MNVFTIRLAGLVSFMVALAPAFVREALAFTLIVAPARYSVMQVAQDVLLRSPAVLVSYQGSASTEDPKMHAWNGREWVAVTLKDFRELNFLQRMPNRTILVGNDDILPRVILEAIGWSPRTDRITDMSTGALITDFGRILQWSESDWKWFARRYNMTLVDEAAPRRATSWYDQPGPLPDRPRVVPPPGVRPVRPVPPEVIAPEPEPVAVIEAAGDSAH
jgi:hypothetical protein